MKDFFDPIAMLFGIPIILFGVLYLDQSSRAPQWIGILLIIGGTSVWWWLAKQR